MDVPRDYQTKGSKSEKDKHHMILLIHGIFKQTNKKKRVQMNLFTQQKKKKKQNYSHPHALWMVNFMHQLGWAKDPDSW